MPTTDEIKGMIRDVLEAVKTRLGEIDEEVARLEAEKSELQQLLPSWQPNHSDPVGMYR